MTKGTNWIFRSPKILTKPNNMASARWTLRPSFIESRFISLSSPPKSSATKTLEFTTASVNGWPDSGPKSRIRFSWYARQNSFSFLCDRWGELGNNAVHCSHQQYEQFTLECNDFLNFIQGGRWRGLYRHEWKLVYMYMISDVGGIIDESSKRLILEIPIGKIRTKQAFVTCRSMQDCIRTST